MKRIIGTKAIKTKSISLYDWRIKSSPLKSSLQRTTNRKVSKVSFQNTSRPTASEFPQRISALRTESNLFRCMLYFWLGDKKSFIWKNTWQLSFFFIYSQHILWNSKSCMRFFDKELRMDNISGKAFTELYHACGVVFCVYSTLPKQKG